MGLKVLATARAFKGHEPGQEVPEEFAERYPSLVREGSATSPPPPLPAGEGRPEEAETTAEKGGDD